MHCQILVCGIQEFYLYAYQVSVCQKCLDIAFVFTLVIDGRQAARYYFRIRIHSLRTPDRVCSSSHDILTGDKFLDVSRCLLVFANESHATNSSAVLAHFAM